MNILFSLAAFSFCFLNSFNVAEAYNPNTNTTVIPYEVSMIDSDIESQAEYLGELAGDPHMYEFTIGANAKLKLQLSQLKMEEPISLSLIAIKQNNQNSGVSEVGRLYYKDIKWEPARDSILGLSFLNSQFFEAEIGPGTYRVEVSTPENIGAYMLTIGDKKVSPGYFKTLADIRTVQKSFGKSIFSMLKSTYVYYPLGIILLIVLIYFTWRNRHFIQNIHA